VGRGVPPAEIGEWAQKSSLHHRDAGVNGKAIQDGPEPAAAFKSFAIRYPSPPYWFYRRIVPQTPLPRETGMEGEQKVFAEIFQRNAWASRESVSGTGSELGRTYHLRRELPVVLSELNVRSLLDLPCGDFNWMQL